MMTAISTDGASRPAPLIRGPDMANPTGFIDTADVEELQNLLEAYENSMDVGVLDGFLTAAALNPNRPSNEDVIPYVFDEEGDPEAVPDDARLLELIDMRRREIEAALAAGNGLDPVILPAEDEDDMTRAEAIDYALEPWCTGFLTGTSAWGELSDDPEMVERLTPIISHLDPEAFEDSEEARALVARAAENAPKTLEDALLAIVETVFELKKELVPNKPIVNAGPRIGRNDPCPCGSGKKYKQCCGKK